MKRLLGEELEGLSPDLRREALTHVSYANERASASNNERLELLGDAVLYLAVCAILFERYPSLPEGDLTRMRASMVSGASLAKIASAAELGNLIYLGRGEDASGGRQRPRVLGSALEAVVGAVFLEKGWDRAFEFVRGLFSDRDFDTVPVDAKTLAQERVQRIPGGTLDYRVVKVEGPDHQRSYSVACVVNGKEVSIGEGSSKKEAEERAAAVFVAMESLPQSGEKH